MYNRNKPSTDELPSSAQLIKSSLIAMGLAGVLLVTWVLPAEYGIDPTGAGRAMGLTQMGEIKVQLAEEAAAEELAATPIPAQQPVKAATQTASTIAQKQEAAPVTSPAKADEISFKLVPGQGAEVKLEMKKGTTVNFHWTGNGGKVNYDTHGDPYDAPRSFYHGYGKGRFTPEDKGDLEAAFDGYHGWFWRNRTKQDLTITLRVEGDYIALKRVL